MTILLACAWTAHWTASRWNPRWRVAVWRTAVVAMVVVCGLSAVPPLFQIPLDAVLALKAPPASQIPTAVPVAVEVQRMPPLDRSKRPERRSSVAFATETGRQRSSAPPTAAVELPGTVAAGTETDLATARSLYLAIGKLFERPTVWAVMWLLGVVVLATRTLVGVVRLRRLGANAVPVAETIQLAARCAAERIGYAGPLEVLQSGRVSAPCLIGLRRPAILLPQGRFAEADHDEVTAILLHECAHLKQRDLKWNVACHLASIVLWFHPLAWRMRIAHADACDAVADLLAADRLGSAGLYGRILARVALRLQAPLPAAALAMARVSNIRARIGRLQRSPSCALLPKWRARALCAAVLACVFLLSTGAIAPIRPAPDQTAGAQETTPAAVPPREAREVPPRVRSNFVGESKPIASNEPAIEFEGRVLTEEGAPAAGARITAAAVFHSPAVRIRATADEAGKFRVLLPKLENYKSYLLAVRWRDQGADVFEAIDASGQIAKIQGQRLPPTTVRLQRQGTLRGRLLQAEDDRPLANARLFLDTGEVLTTDESGGFEVAGLPMKDHSLIPVARGRVRQYVLFDTTNQPQAELELRLPRGATVRGHVLDEQGRPIPGAYLQRGSSGNSLTLNGWEELCQTDGSFEYSGLSPERLFYSLDAWAPGHSSSSVNVQVRSVDEVSEQQITLTKEPATNATPAPTTASARPIPDAVESPAQSAEGVADVSAAASPRKTITGKVRDPDGQAVAGAKVRWGLVPEDQSVEDTTTDAEGNYSLANVPNREGAAVLVMAPGYAVQCAPLSPASNVTDVTLSRGVTVQGAVTNESGMPIAGVKVLPGVSGFEPGVIDRFWLTELETVTNDQGKFEIAGAPVVNATFDFLKPGYDEQRGVLLVPNVETNIVKLEAGGAAKGTVVDQHGAPVRNFNIRLTSPRNRRPNERLGGYSAGFNWYGASFTDPAGKFLMTEVRAGAPLRLVVSSPGVGRAIVERLLAAPLDELEKAESPTIRLEPFDPLKVHVVSAETGQPIAAARVGLMEDELRATGSFSWGHDDLWMTRTWTDADGRSVFAEPEAKDGTLIVTAPGYARQRVSWPGDAREIEVKLAPGCELSGTVVAEGKPLAEGYVSLRTAQNDGFSLSLFETRGTFQFDGLPAGECDLTISDANGQTVYERKVSLAPGKQSLEPIEAKKAGSPEADVRRQ